MNTLCQVKKKQVPNYNVNGYKKCDDTKGQPTNQPAISQPVRKYMHCRAHTHTHNQI